MTDLFWIEKQLNAGVQTFDYSVVAALLDEIRRLKEELTIQEDDPPLSNTMEDAAETFREAEDALNDLEYEFRHVGRKLQELLDGRGKK